jgi:hypothetical protein
MESTFKCWEGALGDFSIFLKGLGKLVDPRSTTHPVSPIFNCIPVISPIQCKSIAEGLGELIPHIQDPWVKRKAIYFKEGCEKAVKQNEPVHFW